MRVVTKASSDCFKGLQTYIKPGLYEFQLQSIFEILGKENEDHSYNPIFGSGGNGAVLHYQANSDVLKNGELILIDASFQ